MLSERCPHFEEYSTDLLPSRSRGVIVGGLDQGVMTLYDADALVKGQTESAVIASKDKHTGPVQALDFNPFQVGGVSLGVEFKSVK